MDLKELYKKEKGFGVDIEVGGLSIIYYSEYYVEWLEAKIIKMKKITNYKTNTNTNR